MTQKLQAHYNALNAEYKAAQAQTILQPLDIERCQNCLFSGKGVIYELTDENINPVENIQVARIPAQIACSEQLAHICICYHSPGNKLPFSGTNLGDKFGMLPLSCLYTPTSRPLAIFKIGAIEKSFAPYEWCIRTDVPC
jgi:hypothetical protein